MMRLSYTKIDGVKREFSYDQTETWFTSTILDTMLTCSEVFGDTRISIEVGGCKWEWTNASS